jgi:hypothetical protein
MGHQHNDRQIVNLICRKCEQAFNHRKLNERIKVKINNLDFTGRVATKCLRVILINMPEYAIERLSIDNVDHLKDLYHSTYSKVVSVEFFKGKYNTKFYGTAWLGYIAFTDDRKPAAFYGVIPCHFKINNEIFLSAQSADTMTHPDHQKKGLFMQLAKMTYALAKQEGVQFIFGFPNQNSYPGFVKLDWKFMPLPMQLFVMQGSKLPWAAMILKTPILRKLYKLITERNLINPPEQDVSEENGIIRDHLFFQYKNQYTKTFIKKSGTIISWMKNDGVLKIGLLRFSDTESPELVEKYLRQTAKKLGCRSIILMTGYNTRTYKILAATMSPKEGLPIGFYNLSDRNLDFSSVTFEYCDIDIF